jgi:hypothetical protein
MRRVTPVTVLRENRPKTDTADAVIHEAALPGADNLLRLFTGAGTATAV